MIQYTNEQVTNGGGHLTFGVLPDLVQTEQSQRKGRRSCTDRESSVKYP